MKKTALILLSIAALAAAGCKDKPKTEAPQQPVAAAPAGQMPGGAPGADPHAGMKSQEIPAGVGKKAKVTQTMNSGGYTYVEAADEKGEKTWLALPETKVKVGDAIEYPETPPMVNFQSKTLNKTFEKILFIPGIRIAKQ
ncbi:hypothetical protein [Geobacter sp. SVR]|uniref:hypothetical protein n=1 Tax=Geobacter sp. SVR TaxID=2495594 RepID=UPI00143EFDFB|nr:hypothetical protein [Geobacter sp. SVR]BCS55135.1 lipoprotein [Geobacter sp. SVR]GCF85316.1 lipoprotein [Geobacter sp. SVR]